MVLLLTIAVASIAGTLIPQNESIPFYLTKYGEPVYRIFSTLDIFDMYNSWWFHSLLVLLTANIVVCSVDRLPGTWKAVFPKSSTPNPSKFRNLMNKETFESRLSLDALTESCRKLVAGGFAGGGIQQTSEGFFILGEKGRWTRFGVYAVHLSIILLLVGALIGSMFGFDGYVNIAEGEAVSAVKLRNSGGFQKLDFQLRCDAFKVTFYPSGSPKEYRSSMTVIEQGKSVLHKEIIVNSPLRYKGINIFQSSYGQVSPDRVVLSLIDNATGKEFKKHAMVGERVDLPEDLGVFTLKSYRESTDFRGQIGRAHV